MSWTQRNAVPAWVLATIALLAMLLPTMPSFAHEVRPAYLKITELADDVDGPVYDILWKQPVVGNGRLAIDPVLPSDCLLEDRAAPEVSAGALIHRWLAHCDLRNATIHIAGLSTTLTDVMLRYEAADGETSNYILRPESPTADLAQGGGGPAWSYFVIGVEHLVFGIDHVLFVLGLVLFIASPVMLLKTITAFTIAHSITLALSVLNIVEVRQGPVEAVIALSILFLARELVMPEERRSRLTRSTPWLMAFVFGLLHGLGFAGALRDIGLPDDQLWLALLLFNVGLEAGQIVVIAIALACGWMLARVTSVASVARIGAYGMGCVAAYWTIDRTLLLL